VKTYTRLLSEIKVEDRRASLVLTSDWLQGRSAFGGWQAALAVQAMRAVVGNDIALRSLQSNFIAPVPVGAVSATAEVLRQGKSVAQLEARILVDGKVAFIAIGIFGVVRQTLITEQTIAPTASGIPEDGQDWPDEDGQRPAFSRNFDYRWGRGTGPYSGSVHRDGQIYVRFRDDAVRSEAHLICVADAIPPSGLSRLTSPSPLSTINWTLELINTINDEEREDWLRFDTSLTAAFDGYSWENTAIWSDKGRLLALSRQCVAVFS
jgi:acyl-CoA thioesterase